MENSFENKLKTKLRGEKQTNVKIIYLILLDKNKRGRVEESKEKNKGGSKTYILFGEESFAIDANIDKRNVGENECEQKVKSKQQNKTEIEIIPNMEMSLGLGSTIKDTQSLNVLDIRVS